MSFADAAIRHRDDARHLASSKRFQNAGHLIGFAAECLVKAELQKAGITVDKDLRKHFPILTQRIGLHATGRLAAAIWEVIQAPKFLDRWQADRRYDATLDPHAAETEYRTWEADVSNLFRQAWGVR